MSLFLTRQDYHDDFPEAFLHLVSTKRAKILFEYISSSSCLDLLKFRM